MILAPYLLANRLIRRFLMKRKLQLSCFEVAASEPLKIEVRKAGELDDRSKGAIPASTEPRVDAVREPGRSKAVAPLVLTRTFARGAFVEGKLRSSTQ